MYQKGRAWIELDLAHLKHNMEQFSSLLPPDCALMPAVKANAYGHGAVLVSKALQEHGVQGKRHHRKKRITAPSGEPGI